MKTVKSKLLDAIESSVVGICDELPKDSCMIFDGMVLLQQLGCVQLSTFGDISEYVLKRITSVVIRGSILSQTSIKQVQSNVLKGIGVVWETFCELELTDVNRERLSNG